jgi:hypothetical protein
MRTAVHSLYIIFWLTVALQTTCFSDMVKCFPPGFVSLKYEPLRSFCKDSQLRAGCEYLEKGQQQQAYQILREYLKEHPSDLIAVTAYTQSLTKEEMRKALSEMQKRQKHLSPIERYQMGITALYLWDQLSPAMPGDANYPLVEQCSRIAWDQLTAAYQSLPEPIVAFYVYEMYQMHGGIRNAIEVLEDQLRRIGGQTIYQRYLQAKGRKWKGVPSLPVPSHLQSSQLWLFSRVVLRLYRTLGIEWGAQVPIFQKGVVVGMKVVKGTIDPAGRDYIKNWYDRIQKALQKNPPQNQN